MEILNYVEQPPSGNVVATFSVALPGGITFHKLRLIRSKSGKTFISFPSWSEEDSVGKKNYYPYVELGKDRKEDFETKVREELKNYER